MTVLGHVTDILTGDEYFTSKVDREIYVPSDYFISRDKHFQG